MSQNVHNNSNFYICVGCLSGDRKLAIITDKESLQYFHGFVDPLSMPEPLTLCWECCAVLQRSLKFRRQVKTAFQQFCMFMTNQNMKTIPSLSRLTTTILPQCNLTFKQDVLETSSKTEQHKLEVEVKVEDDHYDDGIGDEYDEVESERSKILQSQSFQNYKYSCNACALGFSHRAKYDAHLNTKHDNSPGALQCSFCEVVCKDEKALSAHRRRHLVRWRCAACAALYSRCAVAADHVTRHHAPGDSDSSAAVTVTHKCHKCDHVASSLSRLRQHASSHKERVKCELCNKIFAGRSALNTHMFIHKGEKEHACPKCDKKFLFKRTMEVHLMTHNADQSFYCRECDMTFRNKMSFYQHKRYNLKHIDPARLKYTCELCGKSFAQALRLQEHTVAVHLKTTPVKCAADGCSFACSTRTVLRTHMRMVHRGGRRSRNHVCHLCGKAYGSKALLSGHLNCHSGLRPLRCGACAAAFAHEAALYNHTKLVHLRKKSQKNQEPSAQWPPLLDVAATNTDDIKIHDFTMP